MTDTDFNKNLSMWWQLRSRSVASLTRLVIAIGMLWGAGDALAQTLDGPTPILSVDPMSQQNGMTRDWILGARPLILRKGFRELHTNVAFEDLSETVVSYVGGQWGVGSQFELAANVGLRLQPDVGVMSLGVGAARRLWRLPRSEGALSVGLPLSLQRHSRALDAVRIGIDSRIKRKRRMLFWGHDLLRISEEQARFNARLGYGWRVSPSIGARFDTSLLSVRVGQNADVLWPTELLPLHLSGVFKVGSGIDVLTGLGIVIRDGENQFSIQMGLVHRRKRSS